MSALEALQSVQYVTVKGRRLAVVDADSWEAMIEWLEEFLSQSSIYFEHSSISEKFPNFFYKFE